MPWFTVKTWWGDQTQQGDYQGADKRPGSGQRGYGAGDTIQTKNGSIDVLKYQKTYSGVEIELGYTDQGSGRGEFDWIQTIRTNAPPPGAPNIYNDPFGGDDLPFYNDVPSLERMGNTNVKGYDIVFSDSPYRMPNVPGTQWEGELSIVGQVPGGSHYDILGTVRYGFSVDVNGVVVPQPITVTSPSRFQIGSVP